MAFAGTGRDAWIVEALRTPMGRGHREKGWYREVHPNTMLATVYQALLAGTGLAHTDVEDVLIGNTAPFGEQSRNVGRNAWLTAGYSPMVPAAQLDRRCGSAQSAVAMAAACVSSGTHDVVIAGGVEHMGHIPMAAVGEIEKLYGPAWPAELLEVWDFPSMGEAAERIAEQWGLTREAMDEFAVRSHRLAADAVSAGRFEREIIPFELDGAVRTSDQGIRADSSVESLARLKPVFRPEDGPHPGRITAGSASPMTDGAAGLVLASDSAVDRFGLPRRARILDQTTVGVDPAIMLTGPIPATRKLLERNGMTIDDIDLIEVNEAFSSVVLAWEQELKADLDKVNVNGGAIALGHPVGATGARLFATLLAEMERRDVETGLVTMCCGGGLGTATLVQRV
ncbi:thiolase family protein [Prauserella flavalba]|uniref:Acetyl-CoA acetyltransferase n=1 Tax=Prauserella flavalba TaxID=1477506 RepID=A0A318LGA5_9PSEU|nr:thiolase family protein [Prauserella flavalba]PXY18417.1 acetyl-CoA acetyltransferase [Prauserella flavalba]